LGNAVLVAFRGNQVNLGTSRNTSYEEKDSAPSNCMRIM